jgi:hypothetical protein
MKKYWAQANTGELYELDAVEPGAYLNAAIKKLEADLEVAFDGKAYITRIICGTEHSVEELMKWKRH